MMEMTMTQRKNRVKMVMTVIMSVVRLKITQVMMTKEINLMTRIWMICE